jgi:hypothetical protein
MIQISAEIYKIEAAAATKIRVQRINETKMVLSENQ